MYTEFSDYRDYLRPSGSGYSGGVFNLVWHDLWDAKNIRKARYNGSSWDQGQTGAVIATNGINAVMTGGGETRSDLRTSIPVQAFRGATVALQPQIENLDKVKSQAALEHVYLNKAPALFRGAAQQPLAKTEEGVVREASLRVHPNPFNPETRIEYHVPQEALVQIAIYNVLGQKLVTLQDGLKPAGEHSLLWDSRNSEGVRLGAGVYFCKMRIGDFVKTEKMTLLP
ncbi:T9SS type A sorting domain-containing protein [candidate division KSB1 bacterium]|nr:T9SS type A sorting domain-containing protein [candidate division KSB1 bacterium]